MHVIINITEELYIFCITKMSNVIKI